jgi:hypothetical protein
LNAVLRAATYVSFVLVALYLDVSYIWITLAAMVFTIFLYSQHSGSGVSNKEGFVSGSTAQPADFRPLKKQPTQYVEPTPDNPMMNVLQTDYRE